MTDKWAVMANRSTLYERLIAPSLGEMTYLTLAEALF